MFTLLSAQAGGLAMRLPEGRARKVQKKYKTGLFVSYGVVMKEYVAVPDALLSKRKELSKYLGLSYEYAKTLRPKPSKKQRNRAKRRPTIYRAY
ncbi:MAG TPA: hypothetical protein VFB04_08165 [Terriglobales bacterium]|nr:hypothetical protein [Terriglobales bacterium]